MSIMCAVFVPEGIALSTDSRMTVTMTPKEDQKLKGVPVMYSYSDNAQKVVLLNKVRVGIAACGLAVLDDKTISDYLRIFEITQVKAGDSVTDVANKLKRYAAPYSPKVNFLVCGYCEEEPFVYTVNKDVVRTNMKNGKVLYSISWSGEPVAIRKLLMPSSEMPMQENAPALPKMPGMMVNMQMMPLKDAIDFSRFLVDTTIKYQRFEQRVATCGGDIDTLVLTKDDAFWNAHKIFKPYR
ncbi:MAG: hypothetical protein IJA35_05950 [Clostridia bacterium]|nr:hypothetical protein [Clostridia bacterium]